MNNLPDKYRDNIFKKIINFFKSIMRKKDKEFNVQSIQEETISFNNDIDEIEFKNNLQKDYNTIKTREEIIDEINKNPNIIHTLQDERLIKLIDILDDKILELDEEIENLELQIAKLDAEQ